MESQIQSLILSLPIILLALAIHEYAHAKFADMAGDPTPRMMGRVTLNPLVHLDPIGTVMIVLSSLTGFGIGWGRPVLVRPDRMRNPRWDHFVSVAAGPISNLLQAAVYALCLRVILPMLGPMPELVYTILLTGVLVNVGLFCFNLIPLGPLDGHWLVGAFLPDPQRLAWYRFNQGPGALVFLVLVLIPVGSPFDILGRVFYPVVRRVVEVVLGIR